MLPNILITGCSGYLGGTLLHRLSLNSAKYPPYGHLYALVRNGAQTSAVKQYKAEPLVFNPYDTVEVMQNVTQYHISVIFFLIDAAQSTSQECFIKALEAVQRDIGIAVHFVHTSGAKIFSSHCGAPLDHSFSDANPDLHQIQRSQVASLDVMQQPIQTNNRVIELGKLHGVRTYIFVPCVVYGRGEGFGNPISIQTTAIVRAAKAAGRVYRVEEGHPIWPVCHIGDTVNLYTAILRNILEGQDIDHSENGYYHAASGSVAWEDIYSAVAIAMAKRGIISDATVSLADDDALTRMAEGLGCPKAMVAVSLSGNCRFTAGHGQTIGWQPEYAADHILTAMDEEVELILANKP